MKKKPITKGETSLRSVSSRVRARENPAPPPSSVGERREPAKLCCEARVRIEFPTLKEAYAHAVLYGGWIAIRYSEPDAPPQIREAWWYSCGYGPSQIIADCPWNEAMIGTYGEFTKLALNTAKELVRKYLRPDSSQPTGP